MGQYFGIRGCCHSNRSRVEPDSTTTSIHKKAPAQASDFDDNGRTITHKKAYDQAWTRKKAQAWIQSDSGTKDKSQTGDKSNNSIFKSLALDDRWQTNDASATVENVTPSESPCDEIDGDHKLSRKGMNQDQNDQAQSDHTHHHENEVRSVIGAPDDFENFIRHVIVPKFEQQRLYNYQKQFAVLLLATDKDLRNISQMKFCPHDPPIINNGNLSMPDNEKEYHNYIVARPRNDNHHAEKEIFEHLDQLWNGFMRHNHGIPPKCFILYSWNFSCTKCTQLIIDSFNKPQYKSVSVIVAATAYWDKEEHEIRHQNEAKMEQERFHFSCHRGITLPNHTINDSGS